MPRTLLVVAVLAILASLLFVVMRPGEDAPQPGATEVLLDADEGQAMDRSAAVAEQAVEKADASAPEVPAMRTDVPAQRLAVIRGRCVDENGQPLAGVAVRLRGWGGNSERMARHELDHGKVEWSDPEPVVTDADGRFEHRFDPPPPYQFICEPEAEGRVRVYGRWSSVAPGAELDMGDVVLEPGVEVTGRVVDEAGLPVAKRHLRINPADRSGAYQRIGELTTRAGLQAYTDERGRFRGRLPLPAGSYSIDVGDAKVRSPSEPVRLELPSSDLHVVVVAQERAPSIEGVVLDERGAPLSRARIVHPGDPFGMTTTNREGRFVLQQNDRTPKSALELSVQAEGHAEWSSEEAVEWGTHDLRIVMSAGPPMTITVRRADDGAPVERFGILLAPVRGPGQSTSMDGDLKHLGDHRDGVLRIDRAATGRYRLTVVPAESTELPESAEQEIEIELGVPERVDVLLQPLTQRSVVVSDPSGRPVEGARVELLLYRGSRELTIDMQALPPRVARMNSPDHIAVLVDEGATDAEGRVTLRGRSKDVLALRLPGPGHVPMLVTPFSVDAAGDARVTVGAGATLRGRIEPLEVLAMLREGAGLPPTAANSDPRLRDREPTVSLVRTSEGRRETFPLGRGQKGIQIRADGTFEIAGAPPGSWDVAVRFFRTMPSGVLGITGTSGSRIAARGLTLEEGRTREVVLDLGTWRRHVVTVRARLDGRPFTGSLVFRGELPSPIGQPETDWVNVRLASEEEVQVTLAEGAWKVQGQAQVEGEHVALLGPEFVVGPAGRGLVEVAFVVASLPLRVLDHEGNPVAGVVVTASLPDQPVHLTSKPTDADGCSTLRGPRGTVQLHTRRKPLMDDASFHAWARDRMQDGSHRLAVLQLGTADLVIGASEPHTIRLPAEWAELPK